MRIRTFVLAAGLVLLGTFVLATDTARAQGSTGSGPQTSEFFNYTVQRGDTWLTISRKFGVDAATLIDFNNLRSRPNLIFVGEVVRIPIAATTPVVATTAAPSVAPRTVSGVIRYTVQRGDTWTSIARRFGVDAGTLIDFNGLRSRPDLIFVGEVIQIPTATAAAPRVTLDPSLLAAGTDRYTVRRGDTWATISSKFGVAAATLIDFNGLRTRPDLLFVGETLRLPFSVGFTPSYVNPFFYLVQPGDTVQTLRRVFEIDKFSLLAANGMSSDLDNNAVLPAGEVLLIPAGPHRPVVQPRETLFDIAARYHTSTTQLLRFNPHISSPSVVAPGISVYVPIQFNTDFFPALDLVEVSGAAAGASIGSTGATALGGPIMVREVALRRAVPNPNASAGSGSTLVTLGLVFRGGQEPFTLLVSGVETPDAGIFAREDGGVGYLDINFQLAAPCGGNLGGNVVLRSGDGQAVSHDFVVGPIACPSD